jgi:hypothetical protein
LASIAAVVLPATPGTAPLPGTLCVAAGVDEDDEDGDERVLPPMPGTAHPRAGTLRASAAGDDDDDDDDEDAAAAEATAGTALPASTLPVTAGGDDDDDADADAGAGAALLSVTSSGPRPSTLREPTDVDLEEEEGGDVPAVAGIDASLSGGGARGDGGDDAEVLASLASVVNTTAGTRPNTASHDLLSRDGDDGDAVADDATEVPVPLEGGTTADTLLAGPWRELPVGDAEVAGGVAVISIRGSILGRAATGVGEGALVGGVGDARAEGLGWCESIVAGCIATCTTERLVGGARGGVGDDDWLVPCTTRGSDVLRTAAGLDEKAAAGGEAGLRALPVLAAVGRM